MKKIIHAALLFCIATPVLADKYLIEEMESLKSSLAKNDPDRGELSLRLADVYFDESIQEGEGKEIGLYREKALKLYDDVLYGKDGLKKPSAQKSIIIKYQMARVLGKLGQVAKAKTLYTDVFESELSTKKMKRESAFSIAEFNEEQVKFEQADKYYLAAINLCESIESCNYAHYKRAWLYYKEVKIDTAIKELKLSLWDQNGVAREKIVNDLLLFFSVATTDGYKELAYMKDLAIKSNRPKLVRRLVEAFYGSGNRVAGGNVLADWNEAHPSLFYEARLLEESYGFRDWDKVRLYLSKLEKRTIKDIPRDKVEKKELKAMLKRVIVQIGSEADEDTQYNGDLVKSIDFYLSLYPQDEMRLKLQQGWLKAQSDNKLKLVRLKKWIDEDIKYQTKSDTIAKLRESRLSLAQKEKKQSIIKEESFALTKIGEEKKKRSYEYIYAHSLYTEKKYNEALPIFKKLSIVEEGQKIDDWAVKSQNLALDIYNIQKNYDGMIAQSNSWIINPAFSGSKKLQTEVSAMKKIELDAKFQKTVALGETQLALNNFMAFCFDGVYPDKSCPNAKVLSVKLKDQASLVRLLEKEGDHKALLSEYEAMGEFGKAAALNQKMNINQKSDIADYLKTALLYELAKDFKSRDRILNQLVKKTKKDKKIEEKWIPAIYLTLDEAQMINAKTLTMPWPMAKKIEIAERLEASNSSKLTKNIIQTQKTYTGPMWSKFLLDKGEKLFNKQAKMSFYGRNSIRLFKRKDKAVSSLVNELRPYLEGADLKTRIYLLEYLKRANLDFAAQIKATPLPADLTPEVLAQVKANLEAMAAPYITRGSDYKKLQDEQLVMVEISEKDKLIAQTNSEKMNFSAHVDLNTYDSLDITKLDYTEAETYLSQLKENPTSKTVLRNLQTFYKTKKALRIASYFTGRINNIKEQND